MPSLVGSEMCIRDSANRITSEHLFDRLASATEEDITWKLSYGEILQKYADLTEMCNLINFVAIFNEILREFRMLNISKSDPVPVVRIWSHRVPEPNQCTP